ncbi:sporulation integral membrane protein YlbJ [Virgibacillus natechei]|uniref:Sporulation integral membrane protein YlbJ n=1 Tax=Virgibacillus natechei TaxID=1216297 RepID=A0ABS4IBA9_9BACI|nr:sporulation integral membrane protein YlbJ [Virgibacillus natechei]MBP1968212.1 sporulation integral membrane protein YlbJ [Virgibacillus natechei]UZD14517.1 sporulation integral membrane protein YlbJ [Virgibacillus natechei]
MKQIAKTLLLSIMTSFFAFALLKFPDQSLEASIRGLNIWWEVVFPSLLPFFITAELLISFGVVKFIGVLFEPIMRPLFNVPGIGSFGWIMGMSSGYPTGAKIAARLREEEQLSQIEAERLVSFTNASSPLFIFGAVSIGFFHDVKLGVLLATCHYIGNALVGICMRFYRIKEDKQQKKSKSGKSSVSIRRAFKEMHQTRIRHDRPLGEVLGDAVLNSIKTLVVVGGFIVLFSVITKLLFIINISPIIASVFEQLLNILSLPGEIALPFLSGLFEITIGAQMLSQITTDSFLATAILVSFILGFNGFSVQAQVASIIGKTDIRFAPYFFSRLLHGIIASLLTVILYKPLYLDKQAFEMDDVAVSQEVSQNFWVTTLDMLKQMGPIITIVFLGLAGLILYKRILKKDVA